MPKFPGTGPGAGLQGRVVTSAQPMVGAERDEISALVSRIKKADELARQPRHTAPVTPMVTEQDLTWATEWQLPKEVFEYFVLERAA